jgi:hypothetical protein
VANGIPAYQKGLDTKGTVESDRIAATTKAPAGRLEVAQAKPWITGCSEIKHDPDLSITYLKHNKLPTSTPDIDKAISYIQQAPTGVWLLGELRKQQDLMVGVHFFSALGDYPWPNDVTPNESGHCKLMSSAASPVVVYWVTGFAGKRPPECIADTLFHELLHVWYLRKYSGDSELLGTGHDSSARISIDAPCNKTYAGFESVFETKLKAFDADLQKNIPGAKRCCE